MGVISKWLNQGGGMGNTIVIIGRQHSGKTTILCNIFKTAIEDGFDIITTTNIFNPPPQVHLVNKASSLFKEYAHIDNNVVLAFDDAQAYFDSTSLSSTKQSKINQRLYIYIAKLQANMIFIAHQPEKIPWPVWDTHPLVIYAVKSPKDPNYYMEINETLIKVPRSPYKFPKAYIPSWKWDIDMAKLDDRLSSTKANSDPDQIRKNKQTILDFLGEDNGYHFTKKDEIQILLKYLEPYFNKDIKLNQKFIAEVLEVDPGYISRIKQEF